MIVTPSSSEHSAKLSFFRSIMKRFDGSEERCDAYLNLMILAAERSGEITDDDLDQISFLLQEHKELRNISWQEIEEKIAIVKAADISAEQRLTDLSRALTKPEQKQLGLQLVTSMLFESDRKSSIDFLDQVADELHVAKSVRADLLTPWSNVDSGTHSFNRCSFNNPSTLRQESLFAAMAHAENEVELALLTHKLTATRNSLGLLGDQFQISAIGETIQLGSGTLRIDAFLSSEQENWLCRFMGNNEILFPEEFQLLSELLESVDSNAHILIGHTKRYSRRDLARLEAISDQRVLIKHIPV